MGHVAQTTERIDRKIDFSKLPDAEGAEFNSYDNRNEECLPGTRTELLRQITEWPMSSQGKCIFWLCGMAGTGKSTISRTVAKLFDEDKLLAASFFFERGEGDRSRAKRLFPTIVRQMLDRIRIHQLEIGIQKAISDNPNIAERSLTEQFEKLLLEPLLSLKQSNCQTLVIVLDALDECEDDDDIRVILQLLPRLGESSALRVRIFVTSRPEFPIRLGFSKIAEDHQDLVLHDIPEEVTAQDISLFLKHRLSEIRSDRSRIDRSLPPNWPGDKDFQALVRLSVPLFIFAATVCRIFEDPQRDPVEDLTEIFANRSDGSQLDATYLPVLNRFLKDQEGKQKKQRIKEFQEVIGTIVMLESPLSVKSLSCLVGLSEGRINMRLSSFHSVIRLPKDETLPVRPFHLSFRDFLLDEETREKTPLWVDEKEKHQKLTSQCLSICDDNLRRNICALPSEGTLRVDIDQRTIDGYIRPELQYSCHYWVHHLVRSKDPNSVLPDAFSFLQRHFLHWMEAMSLLGLASEVVRIITQLQPVTHVSFKPYATIILAKWAIG